MSGNKSTEGNGKGSPKIAKTPEEQKAIKDAAKARRRPKSGKMVNGDQRKQTIPEAGNRMHLAWVVDKVMKLKLDNENQMNFMATFTQIYANIKPKELKDSGKTRLGLTFEKSEAKVGKEHVKRLRNDWEQSKKAFVEIVRERPFKDCCDEVAAQRQADWVMTQELIEQSSAQVATTVADIVGKDGLAALQQQLLQPA